MERGRTSQHFEEHNVECVYVGRHGHCAGAPHCSGDIFYFRALDRYPGGNADMFTVKLTLQAAPSRAPALRAAAYHNWEGEHWTYPEATVAMPELGPRAAALLAAAQAMLDAGLSESTFTVVEKRADREAYDTEWSALEFSLATHEPGAPPEGRLVLRLLQRAVPRSSRAKPPDALSGAFMDAVHALVGIGRVRTYSDGEDVFSKTHKPIMKGTSLGYKTTAIPLYLDEKR